MNELKPSNEEVYNALNVLKNLCSEIGDCLNCPLHMENFKTCGLMEYVPDEWEINGVREWKAFE